MKDIDLQEEVKCLVTFADHNMHDDVLESCNRLIKILEEVREIAVANIKKESEINQKVTEIKSINI